MTRTMRDSRLLFNGDGERHHRAARGSIPFISTRLDCGVTHHTNFRPSIQFQVEYSRWHRKELVLVAAEEGGYRKTKTEKYIF